ncbi:hypothetical protein HanPI659440_Chr08g0306181 [Helianthus annuus]|nr:hypothetical protein HanPI659440_Chr08g0306181 [Helianthus annuus]
MSGNDNGETSEDMGEDSGKDLMENDQDGMGSSCQDMVIVIQEIIDQDSCDSEYALKLFDEMPEKFSSKTNAVMGDILENNEDMLEMNRDVKHVGCSYNDNLDIKVPFVRRETTIAKDDQMSGFKDDLSIPFDQINHGILGDDPVIDFYKCDGNTRSMDDDPKDSEKEVLTNHDGTQEVNRKTTESISSCNARLFCTFHL